MENPLNITALNDFIFCPVSIYFHNLYEEMDVRLYQSSYQLNGSKAHEKIDNQSYTGAKSLQGMMVYSDKYNLIGKIDLYEIATQTLVERKKRIKKIYDGYIYQLYAQYFAMREMGYNVNKLVLRSLDDNKNYLVALPEEDELMLSKFEKTIMEIEKFKVADYIQTNKEKCSQCIYSPYCDREVL